MEYVVVSGIHWKGEWCEAGTTIIVESPADDELLRYYAPFGALRAAESGGGSGPGEPSPEPPPESGEEPAHRPAHVGTRQRPRHEG